MITYTLPGTGITRTIDNDFEIGDMVKITFANGVRVYNKRVDKIYVTFTGIYYMIDGWEINQDNEKITIEKE